MLLLSGPCQSADPGQEAASDPLAQARAQVLEALKLVQMTRASVSEYFNFKGEWPTSVDAVPGPGPLSGPAVDSVEVIDGTIVIRFATSAAEGVADRRLALRPTVLPGKTVSWTCGYAGSQGTDPESGPAAHAETDVEPDVLPDRCR